MQYKNLKTTDSRWPHFSLSGLIGSLTFVILLSSYSIANAASVSTDLPDYAPGDSVIITGAGFSASETVTVQIVHADGDPLDGLGHDPWNVAADLSGSFETFWIVPFDDNVGEILQITADGNSSGLSATTTFIDGNTILTITSSLPDTICAGAAFEACALLEEKCGGGATAPLAGRPVLFFLNNGDCGIGGATISVDTVLTDANGLACLNLVAPIIEGQYSLRVKYNGEDKPGTLDLPNSACDPTARKKLSNSNDCVTTIVDSTASSCPTTNSAPSISCPANSSVFLCGAGQVCVSPLTATDVDGNIESLTVSFGSISGDSICFQADTAGLYSITAIVTDSLGLSDTCTVDVTVMLNTAPVATSPANSNMFVCDLSTICLPGFSTSDADGNISSVTVSGGTLSGDTVCFTPVVGANVLTLIATDDCGAADTSITTVTVTLNAAPVATSPANSNMFVCDLSTICLPGFSASDADGNLTSVTVLGGTLSGDTVCFTPVVGANVLTLIATDACGAADTSITTVTVTLNAAPVATTPANSNMFVCNLSTICLPGFTTSDADGNISSVTVTGGTLSGDTVCFTPVVGANVLTLIVTDACGAADTSITTVTVAPNTAPVATSPANSNIFACDLSTICLAGFSASDADGNLTSVTVSGGSLSGDTVCFTPVVGANVLTLIATDACGAADTSITTVTISLNSAPSITCPADTAVTFVTPQEICVGPITATDPDSDPLTLAASFGTLIGNLVCFTPDTAGVYTINVSATDSCGLAANCSVVVTVEMPMPPVLNDTSYAVVLCGPGTACFDLPQATGGTPPYSYSVAGQSVVDTFCLAISTSGQIMAPIVVTDAAGKSDTAIATIDATVNSAPQVTLVDPGPQSVCAAGEIICVKLQIVDPDNGLSGTSQLGTFNLSDSTVCFAAGDTSGMYCDIVIINDSCGLADTLSYCVNVTVNSPPVASSPSDSFRESCVLETICLPNFTGTDVDGNIASITLTGGTLNGTMACVDAVDGANVLTLIVTDSCGLADTSVTVVNVTLKSPPEVTCAADSSVEFTTLPQQICVTGFSSTDVDNDIDSISVSFGQLTGSTVCFTADTAGTYTIEYRTVDACGNVAVCTTTVIVQTTGKLGIVIETSPEKQLGKFATINITAQDLGGGSVSNSEGRSAGRSANSALNTAVAGFDFLIKYDRSALLFTGAEMGQFLKDCDWEYFTYRIGPFSACLGCTGDMIRIVAMADQNDGVVNATCYDPLDLSVSNELATLSFLVGGNAGLACSFIPIRFNWIDCGDNTLSDQSGDTLFLADAVFESNGSGTFTEITDLASPFPSPGGPTTFCSSTTGADGITPIRRLNMFNGGIKISCAANNGSVRGDINVNALPHEVADAVMFTQYFVTGLAAFFDHVDISIAASDVNADGLTLTVADLVFLLRIIVGDAPAIPKYDPNMPKVAELSVNGNSLSLDRAPVPIGGMKLVIDGEVSPKLSAGASQMDLVYRFDGNQTHLLVYSEHGYAMPLTEPVIIFDQPVSIATVELGSVAGEIVSANLGTLPDDYSLEQNYPNPFNPATVITFALPRSGKWNLEVYNTSGQLVTNWSGVSEAGLHEVVWDARSYASGVYLYRLVAGDFTGTRKMVLLK